MHPSGAGTGSEAAPRPGLGLGGRAATSASGGWRAALASAVLEGGERTKASVGGQGGPWTAASAGALRLTPSPQKVGITSLVEYRFGLPTSGAALLGGLRGAV